MTQTVSPRDCAVVIGTGTRSGLGGALCARFHAQGLAVYAAGRSGEKIEHTAREIDPGGQRVIPVVMEAAESADVSALFARIAADGRIPKVVVFNAAERNIPMSMLNTTPEQLEQVWRSNCFAGALVGQEALRRMLPQAEGTLIFTGASGSLRGRARFAAFASAKAGLRALAQSMAREFGPKGIHVAHVIIDGVVNGDRAGKFAAGLGKAYLISRGSDGSLHPDAVAESYWQLHLQHRSAWTHELDLRPFKESF